VLHHALMNVCEPVLERAAIFDSFACRKGKGRLAAIERAQVYAGRHGWFLKMDVRKYFDSVPHRTLEGLLARKFKDPAVLALFGAILASYETTPGRGLPIGNLTSQHFANFYLGRLDRFVKEVLQCLAYVRYSGDTSRPMRAGNGASCTCNSACKPCWRSCCQPTVWPIGGAFWNDLPACRTARDSQTSDCLSSAGRGWWPRGSNRVICGGSWNNNARNCRVPNRNNDTPDNRNNNIGFRSVLPPAQPRKAGLTRLPSCPARV
jgi:hypothetical protein